jgi:hypothetical protein
MGIGWRPWHFARCRCPHWKGNECNRAQHDPRRETSVSITVIHQISLHAGSMSEQERRSVCIQAIA